MSSLSSSNRLRPYTLEINLISETFPSSTILQLASDVPCEGVSNGDTACARSALYRIYKKSSNNYSNFWAAWVTWVRLHVAKFYNPPSNERVHSLLLILGAAKFRSQDAVKKLLFIRLRTYRSTRLSERASKMHAEPNHGEPDDIEAEPDQIEFINLDETKAEPVQIELIDLDETKAEPGQIEHDEIKAEPYRIELIDLDEIKSEPGNIELIDLDEIKTKSNQILFIDLDEIKAGPDQMELKEMELKETKAKSVKSELDTIPSAAKKAQERRKPPPRRPHRRRGNSSRPTSQRTKRSGVTRYETLPFGLTFICKTPASFA
ncbi:hypothetical protein BGX26_002339 [Mortierella sp. AD094]|nr:hypothetical protein BGX26_002339 [Mortierella sp. AD094]